MTDIGSRLRRDAPRYDDATAVITPTGAKLSYRELIRQAEQLAEQFAAAAAPGSLIALEAGGKVSGLLAFLAAGLSGRALLPLDLGYPEARRADVLRDARPTVVFREDGDELVATAPGVPVAPRTGLAGVAYVMYTSGSTGTPKGIAVSHQALAERIAGMTRRPGLRPGESMLALTALSFDPALAELLMPLQVGGTVIAAPSEARTDPELFADLLARRSPDVIQATPSFWRLMIAAGWTGLPTARLWTGGEALTPSLAELLLPRAKEVWNVYGPSETTIWSTAQLITDPAAIGLGEPVPGTGLVLDPDGDEGEILLYGSGVAEGYLDRPELTARSFVQRSVAGEPRRCYRSGDRARRRADGVLEFLGRVDHQVKVRGTRVELGDVEATFEAHPAVQEAVAVFLLEDEAAALPDELAVHVVVRDPAPTIRELRRWAGESLPRAVVPTRIVISDQLPRTPSGKADRTALHRAEVARRSAVVESAAGAGR